MSSTSSSECECGQYWPNYETVYNANFKNAFGRNPYYQTMGHPLVYYAEAPRPRNLTHRGRDRKRGSPNCFVKAFRWYTKDHIPDRSKSPIASDMSGFAAWLDVKYDQFLQESHITSEMYHVRLRQTFEAEKVPTTPWKKKRRTRSNETGVVHQKSNQSCRYIMQPKDVTRPSSVCCHPSNFTTTGSECAKKTLARSHSFSDVTMIIKSREQCDATQAGCVVGDTKLKANLCQNNISKNVSSKQSVEKVDVSTKDKPTKIQDFGCQVGRKITTKIDAETQCDVLVPQNSRCGYLASNLPERLIDSESLGPVNKIQRPASRVVNERTLCQPILPCEFSQVKCACKSLDTMPPTPVSKVPINTLRHSERNVKSKSYEDVECQCPEENVVSVDAQTQYVARPMSGFVNNICECENKGFKRNYRTPVQSVPIPSDQLSQCSCKGKIEEESMTERIHFAQTTSQTSNHSICLAKETVEYPFFLKIVCADKLSNENMK